MLPALNQLPTLHQPLHSKVSNYLNNQRRTGEFCDLIIEIENGALKTSINAHFCVVGAQSRFIGSPQFLQQPFSIKNPLKINIHNFHCANCLQLIINFCYEDVVSVPTDHEAHFRTLAKILNVTELLALYDIQQDGEGKELTEGKEELIIIKTTAATALTEGNDVFDEERSYFKLNNPRPTNASNKINYCISCDFKTYRVAAMIDHMSNCEASNLTCSLCEIGFLSWREYENHLKKHSVDMKKPFFCLECEQRFINRAALLVHQPKHTLETPHRCMECGKGFKWKHGLANHLLIHSKEKLMLCDVCGYSTIHMKALKSHKLKHTDESAYFRCTFPGCKHRSNRKENLKLHIETHKQERPFVCEVCGCKFSQNKNLKRHALKHSLTDLNRHQCHLCPFATHRSDKLKEHLQRVHTEKAVQLELPEVVENSFENRLEDEFNLPPISSNNELASSITADGNTKPRKRKKQNSSATSNLDMSEPFVLPCPLIEGETS